MELTTCGTCGYAMRGDCENPACAANPTLSEERLRKLLEARQRRERQEAERAMLRRARGQAYRREEQP